eukprot:13979421-Alexandrium_andersonii.AAC.1
MSRAQTPGRAGERRTNARMALRVFAPSNTSPSTHEGPHCHPCVPEHTHVSLQVHRIVQIHKNNLRGRLAQQCRNIE